MTNIDKHPSCSCKGCRHADSKTKGRIKTETNRAMRRFVKQKMHLGEFSPNIYPGGYRN